MIFSLISYVSGYTSFKSQRGSYALSLLLHNDVNYFDLRSSGDDEISFSTLTFSEKRVRAILEKFGIEHSCKRCGLPPLIYRYRKRAGLLLGVIIWLSLCVFSEKFFWQVDVKGNERVSDGEILACVKKYGIYEGARCDGIDTLYIANECLLELDSLSYMSINIIGNCAEIVVKESVYKSEDADKDIKEAPLNIVAARSGRIKEISVEEGEALVSEGDVVFAGQTLISGQYTLWGERYAYGSAKGYVIAETVREFSASIPYKSTVKAPKKCFEDEKSIIFFTKEIKFSKYSGNIPVDCDKIEKRERVMLFGRIPLPIWKKNISYVAYIEEELILSEADALQRAENEVMEKISRYELVSYEKEIIKESGMLTLLVTARINEDITAVIPMS